MEAHDSPVSLGRLLLFPPPVDEDESEHHRGNRSHGHPDPDARLSSSPPPPPFFFMSLPRSEMMTMSMSQHKKITIGFRIERIKRNVHTRYFTVRASHDFHHSFTPISHPATIYTPCRRCRRRCRHRCLGFSGRHTVKVQIEQQQHETSAWYRTSHL